MVFNILKFIFILLEVLLIFNLLILVHEIGHFLAAKWRGLYVDGFGIWFGKPLWQKKIGGVNYSLGWIPAGGFVKLPQMAPMEAVEGQSEVKVEELPAISALDKIIVAFAGPLFSLGLAFLFAVIVWQVGRPVSEGESTRTVGFVLPGSPADKAGFQVGDQILEIDGHPVTRWGGMGSDSIIWRIVRSEGETVEVKILRDGKTIKLDPVPRVPEKLHWWNRKGLRQIGLEAASTPVVAKVQPDSPAEKAGLEPNDLITEVNGGKLYDVMGIYESMKNHPADSYTLTVQRGGETKHLSFRPSGVKIESVSTDPNSPAHIAGLQVGDIVTGIDGKNMPVSLILTQYLEAHGGKQITLNIIRDGRKIDQPITPQVPEQAPDGDNRPRIGVAWNDDDGIVFDSMGVLTPRYPGPIEQVRASMLTILSTFDAVLSPKSSIGLQHMGGPVMMMRAYYVMFENKDGWRLALWFSVILNVNLAMLNLLPIPVLDGGHIMLALIEAARKRPVNLRILETVQTACALVIIGFMLFIFFFDVQDLPWFGGKSLPMKFRPPAEAQK